MYRNTRIMLDNKKLCYVLPIQLITKLIHVNQTALDDRQLSNMIL